MKAQKFGWLMILAVLGMRLVDPAAAQEMVTIPKARLEELERKEAELEKITGASKTKIQSVRSQEQPDVAPAGSAAPPPAKSAVVQPSQPLASLPPRKEGEPIQAMDLANDYHANPAAANERYKNRKLTVRGEVSGFHKPIFRRDYQIILKTASRESIVTCEIFPPEKYSAVFTTKNGSELVGLMAGETRVPLLKVGDIIEVVGQCKGMRDSAVSMVNCEFKPAR